MRLGLARLELHSGRTASARSAAMDVLRRSPDDVDAMLIAGLAFQREGNRREAKKHLERGVRLRDTYADFHLALGIVAEEEHNERQAMERYSRTLALDSANHDAQVRRERLAARMKAP
jgi:Tfp pilus assembly protein PilF